MASRHRTKYCEIESLMPAIAPILIPMPMPAPVNSDLMLLKSQVSIGVGELSHAVDAQSLLGFLIPIIITLICYPDLYNSKRTSITISS